VRTLFGVRKIYVWRERCSAVAHEREALMGKSSRSEAGATGSLGGAEGRKARAAGEPRRQFEGRGNTEMTNKHRRKRTAAKPSSSRAVKSAPETKETVGFGRNTPIAASAILGVALVASTVIYVTRSRPAEATPGTPVEVAAASASPRSEPLPVSSKTDASATKPEVAGRVAPAAIASATSAVSAEPVSAPLVAAAPVAPLHDDESEHDDRLDEPKKTTEPETMSPGGAMAPAPPSEAPATVTAPSEPAPATSQAPDDAPPLARSRAKLTADLQERTRAWFSVRENLICADCNGRGFDICQTCDGTGQLRIGLVAPKHVPRCPTCKGKGRVVCRSKDCVKGFSKIELDKGHKTFGLLGRALKYAKVGTPTVELDPKDPTRASVTWEIEYLHAKDGASITEHSRWQLDPKTSLWMCIDSGDPKK
jgi:hypothetical protein